MQFTWIFLKIFKYYFFQDYILQKNHEKENFFSEKNSVKMLDSDLCELFFLGLHFFLKGYLIDL